MTRLRYSVSFIIAAFMLAALPAMADVTLPALIGDHMVLQRDLPVKIWGQAQPGEKVVVAIADQKADTAADAQGRWLVTLKPLPAGGPYTMTISGANTITVSDILVGDVWICGGQSNMRFTVVQSNSANEELKTADHPNIRLFSVADKIADQPQDDCKGEWRQCTPSAVRKFSAVGYFFGRDLHKSTGVPVGLVMSAWGGTPAESWTTKATLQADEALMPILARWDRAYAAYPEAKIEYDKQLEQWKKDANQARAENKPKPRKPDQPKGPGHSQQPVVLYNGMIHPLLNYGIAGAIWYQGESNADRAYQYRTLFPAMIRDWRRGWGQGDFPFLFVQLANYRARQAEPGDSDWAELREAQTMALAMPNTAMALAIDIGEGDDIHPKNKQDVGQRLALAARRLVHKQDVDYQGPMFESIKTDGNAIRIHFKNAQGGLVVKGDGPVQGFAIAGADRKFVWADARIDGETVVVSNDKVPNPVAVRYAWADNPACNLYDTTGLPACPFRTDDWPGVTADRR